MSILGVLDSLGFNFSFSFPDFPIETDRVFAALRGGGRLL